MVIESKDEVQNTIKSEYDRKSELIAFDQTKAGVKGLVDAGVKEVPRIFIHPSNNLDNNNATSSKKQSINFPVVDLDGIDKDPVKRKEVVDEVKDASANWGFFQVINHGIPVTDLEEMIRGARRFFELDTEVKKEWYSRDLTKKVIHYSNIDLHSSSAANWRDSFYCVMVPNPPKLEELPEPCREILMDYSGHMMKLGCILFELLSEGLGLNSSCLRDMGCADGLSMASQYYPACPQPELTIGIDTHSDHGFLTILNQDNKGGLQVLNENQWIDVSPRPDALVVNIGDLLQLISNDKFKSVEHRVLAQKIGPRISIASFFTTGLLETSKLFGPLTELLSENNPSKYRATTVKEYLQYFKKKGFEGTSTLSQFKI